MSRFPNPLARHLGERRPDAEEMAAMRARAWRQQGVVVIDPEAIADPWLRQGLINEATRRYGSRNAGGRHG